MPPPESAIPVADRLGRWRDAGAITPEQHDAIGAIVRKARFSVALEIHALLYLGVVAMAGGVLWTVQTHFATIGDAVIVLTRSVLAHVRSTIV